MATTIYDAEVRDGRVALASGATLPDRARVYVVVPDPAPATVNTDPSPPQQVHVRGPRLANPGDAARLAKTVLDLDDA